MAWGYKLIETRSWGTTYRGLIAIHAAKNREALKDGTDLALEGRVFDLTGNLIKRPFQYPLGCIVAVGELVDCQPTTELVQGISSLERELGNYYSANRWGWVFKNIKAVEPVIPYRGEQKLFILNPIPALEKWMKEKVHA